MFSLWRSCLGAMLRGGPRFRFRSSLGLALLVAASGSYGADICGLRVPSVVLVVLGGALGHLDSHAPGALQHLCPLYHSHLCLEEPLRISTQYAWRSSAIQLCGADIYGLRVPSVVSFAPGGALVQSDSLLVVLFGACASCTTRICAWRSPCASSEPVLLVPLAALGALRPDSSAGPASVDCVCRRFVQVPWCALHVPRCRSRQVQRADSVSSWRLVVGRGWNVLSSFDSLAYLGHMQNCGLGNRSSCRVSCIASLGAFFVANTQLFLSVAIIVLLCRLRLAEVRQSMPWFVVVVGG